MATDVTESVVIARRRADVAAFMFDPANDVRWTKGVVASRALTDGPLVVGSLVERTVRFAGRTFTYRYETVARDGDASVELRVENPFPMQVTYVLEDVQGGTRATIRARGEAGGFFRLASPLLNGMVRRNIRGDLSSLVRCLSAS